MGLLDGIVGQVLSASNTSHTNQNQDLVHGVLQMLGNSQSGGLSGLVRNFEQAGLAHLIQGSISTGPNPQPTAQQVEQGLGPQNMMALAQRLGVNPQMVSAMLVQVLPALIDKLTPQGQLPQQSALEQEIGGLGGLSNLASLLGGLAGGGNPPPGGGSR